MAETEEPETEEDAAESGNGGLKDGEEKKERDGKEREALMVSGDGEGGRGLSLREKCAGMFLFTPTNAGEVAAKLKRPFRKERYEVQIRLLSPRCQWLWLWQGRTLLGHVIRRRPTELPFLVTVAEAADCLAVFREHLVYGLIDALEWQRSKGRRRQEEEGGLAAMTERVDAVLACGVTKEDLLRAHPFSGRTAMHQPLPRAAHERLAGVGEVLCNRPDRLGVCPLAARFRLRPAGAEDLLCDVDILLRYGASVDGVEEGSESDGVARWPPIVAAAKRESYVRRLLDAGADPIRADVLGRTVLHGCKRLTDDTMAQVLLQGADPIAADANVVTPLMTLPRVSLQNDSSAAVARMRFLLQHGADATATDARGNSVLHRAPLELLPALIEAGADPNLPNLDGQYPLFSQILLRMPRPESHFLARLATEDAMRSVHASPAAVTHGIAFSALGFATYLRLQSAARMLCHHGAAELCNDGGVALAAALFVQNGYVAGSLLKAGARIPADEEIPSLLASPDVFAALQRIRDKLVCGRVKRAG